MAILREVNSNFEPHDEEGKAIAKEADLRLRKGGIFLPSGYSETVIQEFNALLDELWYNASTMTEQSQPGIYQEMYYVNKVTEPHPLQQYGNPAWKLDLVAIHELGEQPALEDFSASKTPKTLAFKEANGIPTVGGNVVFRVEVREDGTRTQLLTSVINPDEHSRFINRLDPDYIPKAFTGIPEVYRDMRSRSR